MEENRDPVARLARVGSNRRNTSPATAGNNWRVDKKEVRGDNYPYTKKRFASGRCDGIDHIPSYKKGGRYVPQQFDGRDISSLNRGWVDPGTYPISKLTARQLQAVGVTRRTKVRHVTSLNNSRVTWRLIADKNRWGWEWTLVVVATSPTTAKATLAEMQGVA